jgi:hypothetical protein
MCRWDHVRLIYDLPNGTTIIQKIVASSIFPVTEILPIEDHKLNSTFLNIAFASQNLLKPTSGQTNSDTNWRIREGDQRGKCEWEPIKIPRGNLTYILNRTQRASFLTQPWPHSYWEVVGHRNRVSYQNHSQNPKRCKQSYVRDFRKPKSNQ